MPWKVIEFQDPSGEILVARVPQQGTAEFISGSSLIVQEGQIAVFYHEGRAADAFRPGRYELCTQNLPVLSKLLKILTLSPTPFRSYVYFVSLKTFTNLGWGTPTPILFSDAELRMVNLRAHGSFAIRIRNLKAFLLTIVGTKGLETTFGVHDYLRKIIVSRFAQVLPEILTTVVDLARQYSEIASRVKTAVFDDFAQYGIELVDLLIEAITLPPEVQESINRAASTRAVGADELGHYQQVSLSEALRDAAKQGGKANFEIAAGMGGATGMPKAPQSLPAEIDGKIPVEQLKVKIRQLKALVDEGLITEEDFATQKRRLMEQL